MLSDHFNDQCILFQMNTVNRIADNLQACPGNPRGNEFGLRWWTDPILLPNYDQCLRHDLSEVKEFFWLGI